MNRQDDAPSRFRRPFQRAQPLPWLEEGFASWLCHRLAWALFIITTVHCMVGLFVDLPLHWWQFGILTLGFGLLSIALDRLQDDDEPVVTEETLTSDELDVIDWTDEDEANFQRVQRDRPSRRRFDA